MSKTQMNTSKCLHGEAVFVGCSVRLHDQDANREQAGEGGDQRGLQNQVDGSFVVKNVAASICFYFLMVNYEINYRNCKRSIKCFRPL